MPDIIPLSFFREDVIAPFNGTGQPIYALMITGKSMSRIQLALLSIASFLSQDYPNRYLVIANDGMYRFQIPTELSNRIIEVYFPQRESLGELRNQALRQVPVGALTIQWDDDDWHHACLMRNQYEVLERENADAVSLAAQVKYAFTKNSAWEHELPAEYKTGFAGTIMFRRFSDVFYPQLNRHEDSIFWAHYIKTFKTATWQNPAYYYIRFVHADSGSGLEHFKLLTREADLWVVSSESDDYLKTVLPFYGVGSKQFSSRRLSSVTRIIEP